MFILWFVKQIGITYIAKRPPKTQTKPQYLLFVKPFSKGFDDYKRPSMCRDKLITTMLIN